MECQDRSRLEPLKLKTPFSDCGKETISTAIVQQPHKMYSRSMNRRQRVPLVVEGCGRGLTIHQALVQKLIAEFCYVGGQRQDRLPCLLSHLGSIRQQSGEDTASSSQENVKAIDNNQVGSCIITTAMIFDVVQKAVE